MAPIPWISGSPNHRRRESLSSEGLRVGSYNFGYVKKVLLKHSGNSNFVISPFCKGANNTFNSLTNFYLKK